VTFLAALRERILVGDGANGTCLAARGFDRRPYDLACLEAPDLVRDVHREYFEAGADFVETNSFYANSIRLGDLADRVTELNEAAARLAREAASGFTDRYVLGAIGPCGKPIEPIGSIKQQDYASSVAHQAKALETGGVDGFILETFVDLVELRVAVNAVRSVSNLPIVASKAFIEDGEALAEGLPMTCAHEMLDMGVEVVGANCVVGPQRMLDLVRMMAEAVDGPILAFPTPGLPQLVKGALTYDSRPSYFAKAAARLVEAGATVVGGCCGTTPEHIKALRAEIDGIHAKPRLRSEVRKEAVEKAPLASTPPSELSEKLRKKRFVVAVEMDVPRGLKIDRLLAGAKTLKIAGADIINISDGARARLRMNPSAVANLIQTQVGIEATMHFSCRDRNLLAIQSDLLGCHAIGVRNILAVTGDPANVGDYPSATSVFDIDSIGLVRILKRFNEGIDMAGYSVGIKCGFTIAVAFNPLAHDHETEWDRLRRKVDAGANLVYTQPVFDLQTAEIAAEACQKYGVPFFIGVLPLRSNRHAEFMHNEVPGISVPEHLRKALADAASDADALEFGIGEATKLASQLKSMANGLYLMPPFGNAAIAERVMQGVQ
jgi:homocysteine S-methyltransferase